MKYWYGQARPARYPTGIACDFARILDYLGAKREHLARVLLLVLQFEANVYGAQTIFQYNIASEASSGYLRSYYIR